MDELREKVARVIDANVAQFVDMRVIAERVLAIPEISYALSFQKRVDGWNEDVQ